MMNGVAASLGRTMYSISRVCDFTKGRNRKVAALASFLLILYCLSVMCLRPSRPFPDGFHIDPFPDELIYALFIRFFTCFRCQVRSTGRLHKLIRSALMVLETLASLFVACGLLPGIGAYVWAKHAGQIEPGPDAQLERLVLALAVWVVLSAFYRRIRGRNSGLSKLMQSTVIVLTYILMLNELDMTVVGGAFVIWLAMSVLGLDLWIEATGGTEHLREWGMSLFGHPVLLDETNFTWPMAVAVWIGLSTFYGICEKLVRDGADLAPEGVLDGTDPALEEVASSKSDTGVKENLVGIQDQIQEVMKDLGVYYRDGQLVGFHGGDVRVVGIYGTGGVGKTTLAKVVYEDIASLFDGCSYLEDINARFTESEGLESLQNQLISDLLKRSCPIFKYEDGAHIIKHRFHNMRVLIILDGVHHDHQLEPFIGELSWFGPRSRIIVTTRDYGLIDIPKVAERYEVKPLRPLQAIFLFRRHAYRGQPFPVEDGSLSDRIVSVTGRIPLAIIVLGSLLCRMAPNIWHDTLKMLSNNVDPVEYVFRTSFEFLNCETREIFLDIACFFVRKDISNPLVMWDACGYDPLSGIKDLLDMSLVQIRENNILWMHDQLRDLGRQIVTSEDPESPERRSRLWIYEDVVSLLKERKGTKRVQALNLKFDNRRHDGSACEEFELLPGLRFLKLGKTKITGDCKKSPSNLRWLDWQGCPEIFGDCDLNLKELVILDLSRSKLAHDWKGWSQIKMPELKILNLTGCTGLLMTPDLSGFEKLEVLILEHCSRLVKIDASIAHLKCLVTLNLKFCRELSSLPKELNDMKEMKELLIDGTSIKEIPSTLANLKKLKTLSASNCFSLSSLPESIGQLEVLSVLLLDSAKIVELPDSIGELVQLKQLSLGNCRCLGELPNSIGKLGNTLIELDLSGTGISELPSSIRNLQKLKILKMDSCFIRELPPDIGQLTNLEEMHALQCRSLEGNIPSDIGKLKSLRMLVLGYTRISSLPSGMQSLSCLQNLDLLHCDRIKALPVLPSSLIRLRVISRSMKVMPHIDHLTKLEELCLGNEDPKELKLPSMQRMVESILIRVVGLSFLLAKSFPRLKVLELSHSRLTDLGLRDKCLPQLTKLAVSGANLRRIPQLPSTLLFLSFRGCLSLKGLPTVQCLKSLTELQLSHSAVREIEGLGKLGALEIIDISHCKIRNLDGLGQLTSLRRLMLSDCDYLQELPDISSLMMLKTLEIYRCRKIKNIPGLQEIRCTLEKLHVGEHNDGNSPEAQDQREDEWDAFRWPWP